AIERGCRQLNLLQSTYPAKLELGAHLDAPVHHLAHRSAPVSGALGPLLARILRSGVAAALGGTRGRSRVTAARRARAVT
ncbi:MAG: hypothetical protein ACXVE9_18630, partial [Solirubrobacteraceae bacterium]